MNDERRIMERARLTEKSLEERNDRRIEGSTRNIMDDYNQSTRFVNEKKSAEERVESSYLIPSRYTMESLKQTQARTNDKDMASSISLGLVTVAVPSVKVL